LKGNARKGGFEEKEPEILFPRLEATSREQTRAVFQPSKNRKKKSAYKGEPRERKKTPNSSNKLGKKKDWD